MATINQGILGGVSGTVGTVIGSSWKGIDYIRAKATSYHDANSEAQLATRAVFTKIVKMARGLMTSVIRPIWNLKAIQMSGFNYFFKINFPFIDPEAPLSDCEGITMSIGELPLPADINVQDNAAVPGGVTVTWTDNSGSYGAAATDVLRIVAISEDKVASLDATGVARAAETANILLPFGPGVSARVFAFFENAAKTSYSNDQNFLVEVS